MVKSGKVILPLFVYLNSYKAVKNETHKIPAEGLGGM
jgi:hypothetical protein